MKLVSERREYEMVLVDRRVVDSPLLVREHLDEDAIGRYQERLRITGRVPPLKVQKKTYRVIDGVHRREAALREGAAKLGCEVYDVPDSELRAIAYFSNREHGVPISTSDRNKAILDFYTKDGKT